MKHELREDMKKFCKDFKISPDIISIKVVWHIIRDIEENLHNFNMLTNIALSQNKESKILPGTKDKGTYFRLSHLLVFIFRASIFSFHYKRSDEFVKGFKNAGSITKLLYFIRNMEINNIYNTNSRETQLENYMDVTQGLTNYTLIPPNEVLFKYLSKKDKKKVERKTKAQNCREVFGKRSRSLSKTNHRRSYNATSSTKTSNLKQEFQDSKMNLANMILTTKLNHRENAKLKKMRSKAKFTKNKKDSNLLTREVETELKSLFEYYTSIGNPSKIFDMKTTDLLELLHK